MNSEKLWERTPPFRSEAVERLTAAAQRPAEVEAAMVGLARLAAYSPIYPRVGECGTGMEEASAARNALERLGRDRPATLFKLLRHKGPEVRAAAFFTADPLNLPGTKDAFERMSREDPDAGLRKHASDAALS